MEAIRDTKLGNEDLEKKIQPLVDQFENLTGSLSNLQSANNKVKESTLINQQKLANEAKKTLKLTESMNQLKTLSESMSSGGGAGIDSDLLAEEMKQTQDLLMEEISTRLSLAADESKEANDHNLKKLKNLDGRLRSHKGQMGTTLERLQEEVGSKVGDIELMELHEKIKTESMGMGEQVDGINSQLQSLTTKNDVKRMITALRKKQQELSAIGVKCLVCNQNVPGGMQTKPSSWKHKQFPNPNHKLGLSGGHTLGSGLPTANSVMFEHDIRTKIFDGRVNHQLSDLIASPLRRAGKISCLASPLCTSCIVFVVLMSDVFILFSFFFFLLKTGALRQVRNSVGKTQRSSGKQMQGMPQDGYGPVGWSRIESNEAYVSRVVGNFPETGKRDEPQFSPQTGHKIKGGKLRIPPRKVATNISQSLPTFPELAASGKTGMGSLKGNKKTHLLRV
jgi:hypothetical protein